MVNQITLGIDIFWGKPFHNTVQDNKTCVMGNVQWKYIGWFSFCFLFYSHEHSSRGFPSENWKKLYLPLLEYIESILVRRRLTNFKKSRWILLNWLMKIYKLTRHCQSNSLPIKPTCIIATPLSQSNWSIQIYIIVPIPKLLTVKIILSAAQSK